MGLPRPFTDERAQGQAVLGLGERERDVLLAWVGENLTLVRRSAFGQRILYWSLGIGFVVGLAAQWYRKAADAGNTQERCSAWGPCSPSTARRTRPSSGTARPPTPDIVMDDGG